MPKKKQNLRALAAKVAARYGIPRSIFFNLIQHESSWTPDAVSSAGAIGLTQLMPDTARGLKVNPWDPSQNMEGGARYLTEQYKAFKRWDLALAAYGWGPGAVKQAGGVPPAARGYVSYVLGGMSPTGSAPAKAVTPAAAGAGVVAAPPSALPYSGPSEITTSFKPRKGGFRASPITDIEIPPPPPPNVPTGVGDPGPTEPVTKPYHGGKAIQLPVHFKATHDTDGIPGYQPSLDILGTPGEPVLAPESGHVEYFHPDGAQGGGSMLFVGTSGRRYWLGHLDNGLTHGFVKRGGKLAVISSRHPTPHVHIAIL